MFPKPVAADGFFGLSIGPAEGGPAVVVNTWARRSVERWIFSAAHEYLLLHVDDCGRNEDEEDAAHEREADALAAEFLLPDAMLRRAWEGRASW